ncbi:hypothetical protein ACI65C_004301 [Semiaphis heraclei]
MECGNCGKSSCGRINQKHKNTPPVVQHVHDEEQLNKYLLDTLQNEMSKKTNTSELRETQTGQTYLQQLFNGETSGCEDEHDDTDRWPKNHVLVLIDAFEKNKNMFSSTTVRKEKVWQVIAKHLKNTSINKTDIQCENKWKNLRKSYLIKQRNKKATSQCAFHFEFEEEFDRIYKEEPSFTPVALAANLIQEESAKHYNIDDNQTEYTPPSKKRKTDSLSNMYLFMEKKEESREKRHQESIELQKKSLKLQQDAVEAYSSTMNQFLAIYKKKFKSIIYLMLFLLVMFLPFPTITQDSVKK